MFGEVAEVYERLRPDYPDALYDVLAGCLAAGARVLDVGCGTGKAGRPLARLGFAVLGVEPDPAMAAFARASYAGVSECDFQDWEDGAGQFALVISGQAWHWLPAEVRLRRAHGALAPGGWLALYWNRPRLAGRHLGAEIDAIYARCAPSMTGGAAPSANETQLVADAALASELFQPAEEHAWEWERTLATADYLELMTTHSNHRLLPEHERAALLAALGQTIDAAGGRITESYTTTLWLAQRRL